MPGKPAWYMFDSCQSKSTATVGVMCSAVFWSQNNGLQLQNLTIANNLGDSVDAGTHQAVALRSDGDQVQIDKVNILGRQNTFFVTNSGVQNRLQGMLDFEAALAQAQAACGMVPTAAVGPIVAACRHEAIDFTALGEAAVGAGNLAIPLVKQLTAQVKARDPDAARYVHWGATSQDAIDTGLVLQLRGALEAAETLLEQLLAALAGQADRYRDTLSV